VAINGYSLSKSQKSEIKFTRMKVIILLSVNQKQTLIFQELSKKKRSLEERCLLSLLMGLEVLGSVNPTWNRV